MKAMLLAAGKGTRLYPLTASLPKPMLPVGGKPILEHNLALLARHGFTDVVINLHYWPEVITGHFGDGSRWGVNITYSFERELLGTAGAVKNVESRFQETFLVMYGDNLSRCDLTELWEYHRFPGRGVQLNAPTRKTMDHRRKGGIGTVTVFEIDDPIHSGLVDVAEDGRIRRFVEKPSSAEIFGNTVNAGIYVLEPRVLGYIPAGAFCDFARDVFPRLLNEGEALYAYHTEEPVAGLDTGEMYQRAVAAVNEGRFVLP